MNIRTVFVKTVFRKSTDRLVVVTLKCSCCLLCVLNPQDPVCISSLVCPDECAVVCQWVSLQLQSCCGRHCEQAGPTRFWEFFFFFLVKGILRVQSVSLLRFRSFGSGSYFARWPCCSGLILSSIKTHHVVTRIPAARHVSI